MSIVGEVMENAPEDLTPGERMVLVMLAAGAKRGRRAQIKREQLVRMTRLTPGAALVALDQLTRRGLITPVHCDLRRGQAYVLRRLGPWDRAPQTPAATPAAATEGDTR